MFRRGQEAPKRTATAAIQRRPRGKFRPPRPRPWQSVFQPLHLPVPRGIAGTAGRPRCAGEGVAWYVPCSSVHHQETRTRAQIEPPPPPFGAFGGALGRRHPGTRALCPRQQRGRRVVFQMRGLWRLRQREVPVCGRQTLVNVAGRGGGGGGEPRHPRQVPASHLHGIGIVGTRRGPLQVACPAHHDARPRLRQTRPAATYGARATTGKLKCSVVHLVTQYLCPI